MSKEQKIYWVDLFCGAGGTTTGIHLSDTNSEVLACVNHDANAIKSHYENHPECKHFTEDIRDFKVVVKIKRLVQEIRQREPNCIINIWASLECTNHSNAKGGLPKIADSRTLANHLFMYLEEIEPTYLYIENVREFMKWGAIDGAGKPIKEDYGKSYEAWVEEVKFYGFKYESRILNSADYGAYTTRKRYFGIFTKPEYPIVFPEATHIDPKKKEKTGSNLPEWLKVRDVLDLEDKGKSIFNRKKPYVENTLKRIYDGLPLFAKEGDFFIKYYSTGKNVDSIDKPCATVTTNDRFSKVSVSWLVDNQFSNKGKSIDKPCQTIIARMDKKPLYLVSAESVGGKVRHNSTDSEMTKKIKTYMLANGIADIKMRGAKIPELLQIQGFPIDYKLVGNQKDQKKFIGNAVEVNQAKALIEANYQAIQWMN